MRGFRLIPLFCAILLWGCGSGKQEARLRTGNSPQKSASSVTKVDDIIKIARQHYFNGERELQLGHLEKAKQEFDASIDVLLEYQARNQRSQKIQDLIEEFKNKIHNYEMAALREGDGFTQHPVEPALIDDLKTINVFPPPDPRTKVAVENELKTTKYDVPVEINDTVLSFVRIFQGSRRKEFVGGLVRSGRYIDMMRQIFREEGIPEDLVYTALIESSFKSTAYSHAHAKGFWQFIAGTAQRYDLRMDWWVDERSDFEKSTRSAARYLRDLHGMFGDWYLALAGYNAGENKVLRGVQQIGSYNFWDLARTNLIRQETKNYVPAILAAMILAKDPKKYGFYETIDAPLQWETVPVDYCVDLRLVAECTGVSFEEIKLLNPGLNRSTTPYTRETYNLRLPVGTKETFLAEIAAIPQDKRITWRKHEVKDGDSLSMIANLYRTSVTSIASVNSFDPQQPLTTGQKIVIPIGRSTNIMPPSNTKYASTSTSKKYYTVRKGDTLFKIASRYGCSVEQLRAWNGFSSRKILRPGESVVIRTSSPVSRTSNSTKKVEYKVRSGDTLSEIANNYRIDVTSLRRWNNLESSEIQPGDRLTIYTK